MLYQQKFKTLRMGKKARTIVLGERGKEPIYVVPRPKPVIEVNFWVFREKVKLASLTVMAILAGAAASLFGWQGLLAVCVIGFLIGFCIAGDRETSP